jgi:hypothetical protein
MFHSNQKGIRFPRGFPGLGREWAAARAKAPFFVFLGEKTGHHQRE